MRFVLRSCAFWLAKAVVIGLVYTAGSAPAAAQSFFEQLFGAAPPRPVLQAPVQRLGAPGGMRAATGPMDGAQAVSDDEDGGRAPSQRSREVRDDGKSYQTMCVRACDGYFWPSAYPVGRGDFKREAAACQATCGAQTRLFVRPSPGTDPEEMRDLEGRSYGATPNAFRYRKGLIDGCACKAMPWSDGERARHEGYALIEAEKALRAELAEAERSAAIKAAADELAAKIASLKPKPEPLARPEVFVAPGDDVVAGAIALMGAVPDLAVREPMIAVAEGPDAAADVAVGDMPVSSKARGKARREVVAESSVARERRGSGPVMRPVNRVRMDVSQPKPAAGLFGLGAGGGKYTYPGDR